MSFPYKKIAVFGATSGIGKALAERFVEHNIFVIVIGRRKERLDEFVSQHGADKAEASEFDITKMDLIPEYATDLISRHSDLDMAFLNSGVQRPQSFSNPDSVDIDVIQQEMVTNYTSQVALTKAFLPHLMSRGGRGDTAGIMYTTSGLGLLPSPNASNYSATKAAMRSFILTLKEQIKGSGVKILELLPPAVQTEVHGEEGKDFGMPLAEYTDATWKELDQGKDQVPVGTAVAAFNGFEIKRQEMFHKFVASMQSK